jgi:DNA-binding phage protein
MVTEQTRYTSSSNSSCAASALTPEQRQQISLQALARTEPISQLAKPNQVSRRFVYRQMAKG